MEILIKLDVLSFPLLVSLLPCLLYAMCDGVEQWFSTFFIWQQQRKHSGCGSSLANMDPHTTYLSWNCWCLAWVSFFSSWPCLHSYYYLLKCFIALSFLAVMMMYNTEFNLKSPGLLLARRAIYACRNSSRFYFTGLCSSDKVFRTSESWKCILMKWAL